MKKIRIAEKIIFVTSTINPSNLITAKDIEEYRDGIKVGEEIKGPRWESVIVLAKYKHIAMTTKGCFQWIDLYMYNVKKVDSSPHEYRYYYG